MSIVLPVLNNSYLSRPILAIEVRLVVIVSEVLSLQQGWLSTIFECSRFLTESSRHWASGSLLTHGSCWRLLQLTTLIVISSLVCHEMHSSRRSCGWVHWPCLGLWLILSSSSHSTLWIDGRVISHPQRSYFALRLWPKFLGSFSCQSSSIGLLLEVLLEISHGLSEFT